MKAILSVSTLALFSAFVLSSCKEKEETKKADPAPVTAPEPTAPPAPAPPPPPPAPVVVYYSVELSDIGSNKIDVIKALRAYKAGMRLRDAKDAVDSVEDGDGVTYVLAEKLVDTEANALKATFEAAGATVTLKEL